MTRLRPEHLIHTVASLYEAACDDTYWPVALENLRYMFDGSTACFGIERKAAHASQVIGVGADPTFHDSYRQHYAAHNVLWQPLIPYAAGTVFSDQTLMPKDTFHRSKFFNEWLAPQDAYASIGCKVISDDSQVGFINIQRGRRQTDFDRDDLALMSQLAPALIGAVRMQQRLGHRLRSPTQDDAGSPTVSTDVQLLRLLRRQYKLTPAEAGFALEISKGQGRKAAAARRGITDSTARCHLSSIFGKTGTQRQAQLVRLILQAARSPHLD
jgi:DNA-binding CsgD family transcriptional regulator